MNISELKINIQTIERKIKNERNLNRFVQLSKYLEFAKTELEEQTNPILFETTPSVSDQPNVKAYCIKREF